MMQFRIRNPCIERTFRILGMTDPKYLAEDVGISHHEAKTDKVVPKGKTGLDHSSGS